MEAGQRSLLGRIVRRIARWIRNYFIIVGVIVTLVLVLLLRGVAQFAAVAPQMSLDPGEAAFLHVTLEGQIMETSPGNQWFENAMRQLVGRSTGPYLLDFKTNLERAAQDSQVKGLFLELQGLTGSWAAFSELRQVLATFKESGKPIYAWFVGADTKVFYLASVADSLYMAPIGELTITGPTFQLVYFGEALRKLGVDIEVIRSGRFKSLFEPFVLNKPSENTAFMYQEMLKSLSAQLCAAIKDGRRLADSSEVHRWFEQSFFMATDAKQRGLVDQLAYLEGVKSELKDKLDAKAFPFENYMAGEFALTKFPSTTGEDAGIGLIEASGEMHMTSRGDEDVIYPEKLQRELQWAQEEERVRAVVLRISSPGGAALAADLIWDDVQKLATKKPLVVSMGGYAASGGYYIAAPAAKIFALPMTITGSIGVIGMVPNFHAFEEKYGVSFHVVTESARRDLINPGRKATEADREIMGRSIDEIYQVFISKVAQGRSLTVADVDRVAQGRVWTGADAKAIGLVDELGGLPEAIKEAKKLAQFDEGARVPLLRPQPNVRSLAECLRNMKACMPGSSLGKVAAALGGGLSPKAITAVQGLQRWAGYLEDEPLQAMWFGHLAERLP